MLRPAYSNETVMRCDYQIRLNRLPNLTDWIRPSREKIFTFSYVFQKYFQIFWKRLTSQSMSMKNTMGWNDVQCPFVHQSCKTWHHLAQECRMCIASKRDSTSLFCWKKLFIFSWRSVTSLDVSRLSHMKTTFLQLHLHIDSKQTNTCSSTRELTHLAEG